MIELRWTGAPNTAFPAPRLQYRILGWYMDASGAVNVARAEWSDWQDVPHELAAEAP